MRQKRTPSLSQALPICTFGMLLASTLLFLTHCQAIQVLTYNFLPIQVGPTSSEFSSPNAPFVSVTVCAPGTTSCQTVGNILVDTGSTGGCVAKNDLAAKPNQQVMSSVDYSAFQSEDFFTQRPSRRKALPMPFE